MKNLMGLVVFKTTYLVKDIKNEPGFIWKIWTEDSEKKRSGGIYLFDNEESCLIYLHKHLQRLGSIVDKEDVNYSLRDINEQMNEISFRP